MTMTGSGSAKAGRRSVSGVSKRSMRSLATAAMSGARPAMRREVKARSTSPRRRVWAGGSRSSIESSSTA